MNFNIDRKPHFNYTNRTLLKKKYILLSLLRQCEKDVACLNLAGIPVMIKRIL